MGQSPFTELQAVVSACAHQEQSENTYLWKDIRAVKRKRRCEKEVLGAFELLEFKTGILTGSLIIGLILKHTHTIRYVLYNNHWKCVSTHDLRIFQVIFQTPKFFGRDHLPKEEA